MLTLVFLAGGAGHRLAAQEAKPAEPASEPEAAGAAPAEGSGKPANGAAPSTSATSSDTESVAANRNENVFVSRIDNNAVRDVLVRLGASITMITDPGVVANYYTTEFGRPPEEFPFLKTRRLAGWHGELYENHQNSVFNSRTFFQVGPVQPSRQNSYGFQVGGPIWHNQALSFDVSQRKVRGMVNGNVLVPKADERQPRASDPATRSIVQHFLGAFNTGLPNRPDIDARALNTNSPQHIDGDRLLGRWDLGVPGSRRLGLQYQYANEFVDSFQLIAGQNPDTTLRSQQGQMSLAQPFRGSGVWTTGLSFQRQKTVLAAEPNAVGPFVRFGRSIESLGPKEFFPIDRVQNTYRAGTQLSWIAGSHHWSFGAEFSRLQLNGSETFNHRGHWAFLDNFGRSAIDNLLLGTPTSYKVSIGDPSRGFRSMIFQAYAGDDWSISARWHFNIGLRYGLETAPTEVNSRTAVPYHCDCNNLSPRFGFAFQGGKWGLWRGAYTISYGQVIPATYQQARFNPPGIIGLEVPNPNLVNPLQSFDLNHLGAGIRSSLLTLESTLRDPYAQQYTLNWEKDVPRLGLLRVGYIGSRTKQLFFPLVTNRALPVPGIPLTTATLNDRRADSRYYEVTRVLNMANAYLDAAQATLTHPWSRGLTFTLSYTFGKALDTGADYTSTGSGEDIIFDSSQTEFEVMHDLKGLSRFDAKHALLAQASYDLPFRGAGGPLRRALLQGWNIAGGALFKTGTPAQLSMGSDSPGFGNVDGRSSDRPNLLDPSILGRTIDHPDTALQKLPRSAFAFLRPGEMRGNVGRGVIRKDGIDNVNLAVAKQWILPSHAAERRLLFRAEATNAFNHPQFDEPGRYLVNPNFGQITNTLNDGRIFTLSLRLIF